MNSKRKIIAVTGARSEYDLMYSIFQKLSLHPEILFSIIITGPHLSEKYGFTASFVEDDGFIVADRIFNLIDSDQKIGRVTSIGHQITQLAQTLYREKPDIVLVAGDREEAISVTLTCAYLGIAVAHFFGGDIAKDGNIDNSVRYAASKFAHIHFPTIQEHKANLIKLGEDDWRIFVVGNPALDRIKETEIESKKIIFKQLSLNLPEDTEYCILIQHSIITEIDSQSAHIRTTLDSIVHSGIFCFINYPNSDAGSEAIINAYLEYATKYPHQFFLFKNLDRKTYINLLRNAKFLIGNSSSGLLEAPSIGLPAINIGSRQRGRMHADNVIFVDHHKEEIIDAIQNVLSNDDFKEKVNKKHNPYGDGNTGERVVKILTEISLDNKLLYKDISY